MLFAEFFLLSFRKHNATVVFKTSKEMRFASAIRIDFNIFRSLDTKCLHPRT